MDLHDACTSILLSIILLVFRIYYALATIVLLIFFPLTKSIVKKRFLAHGIEIGGKNPWDITVHDEKTFYVRASIERNFGVVESRLDGVWSTEDFRGFVSRIYASRRLRKTQHPLMWTLKYFNLQTKARSWEAGINHYDAGKLYKMNKNIYYSLL